MSERKQVVIFSCFFTPYVSGAERFVIEIAGRLAPRYDITVITALNSRQNAREDTYEGADGSSYKVKRVGVGSWVLDRFLYVLWAPFEARKYSPEVIHAIMESYAGLALVKSRWLLPQDVLRILTLQSGEQDSLKKRLKVPYPIRWFMYRSPDVITAISTYLKKRAQRYGARNVLVIPNGIEITELKAVERDMGKRVKHRIVCVARLSWEKGHKHLIEAFAYVIKNFSDARLVLVGDGDLESELKKQASELGIYEKISFRGRLSHQDALREMASAEVFVCPSLFEGLGIVFLEAQGVGTPVIGTKVGGIPDVIEDGETGLLVEPKNSEKLAEAIEYMFDHEVKSEEMTREAQKRLSNFSWDSIAEKVADVYQTKS